MLIVLLFGLQVHHVDVETAFLNAERADKPLGSAGRCPGLAWAWKLTVGLLRLEEATQKVRDFRSPRLVVFKEAIQ